MSKPSEGAKRAATVLFEQRHGCGPEGTDSGAETVAEHAQVIQRHAVEPFKATAEHWNRAYSEELKTSGEYKAQRNRLADALSDLVYDLDQVWARGGFNDPDFEPDLDDARAALKEAGVEPK